MPLPELGCKWDHIPKSRVQIVFSSKWERDREGGRGRGEREWERD